MAESILAQSKKAKLFGWFGGKLKVIIIILVLAGGAYYGYNYFTKGKNKAGQTMVQQKNATAVKGDIQLSVDTEGKVVAEDGVELSFSTTGETVEAVYVKVGDTVKKGDKIAKISTTSLQRDLGDAQDNYQSALLSLADAKDGASEDEIKKAKYQIEQAETSLSQSKTSLDTAKTDAEDKVKDAQEAIDKAQENLKMNTSTESSKIVDDSYNTLYSDIENLSITIKNHIYSADKILGIDDSSLNDDFENVLGVTNSSYLYSSKNSYSTAKSKRQQLESALASTNKTNHTGVDNLATVAKAALAADKELYSNLQGLLDSTITSVQLSQSELDSMKSNISSTRSSINSSIASLDKDIDAIDTSKDSLSDLQRTYNDAVANLETVKRQNEVDIKNAEDAVRNKEISLDQAKISYNDLVAPLTSSELQSAVMKVHQAKNNLDKVQESIEEATLTSPIDGQVGAINGKVGSLIAKDNTESFATIINKDTLFAEVSVEESDIANIKNGQKAYVTFDAINGLELEGIVTFVSMTATTSNSGIVTYPVQVALNDVGKSDVKEGMTAFVKFVSSEVKDIITVPVAAVKNVNGAASVQKNDGKYVEVVTGFTDGTTVEIISGLDEGDKIIY